MGNKFNLLVVDDQLGVRRLIYETFPKDEFNVELAGSGFEALDKIKLNCPDVILMDMKMPGMNGLEVIKEIKKMNCSADVVLMTAYGDVEIVSEAFDLGVEQYITKPFDILELRRVVGDLVQGKKVQ